jgi:hypothetical protein
VVIAAEAILLRLVRGPVNLDDLRVLHDTATTMNLSGEVVAISSRREPASSL